MESRTTAGGSSSTILKELQINWEISIILHDYHALISTRIYNKWVSLHSEGFVTANPHQDLSIFTAKHDILYVDSHKVQEHTWTSNPNVGRLITPLWSGTSEKATRSTACHLSKGTLLRGTVTTFIWQRYALCCGGNYFHFIMPEEITTDYLYSSWLFV